MLSLSITDIISGRNSLLRRAMHPDAAVGMTTAPTLDLKEPVLVALFN